MPDPVVADQMKALAEAFRAQAEAMKKKKKKKRWVLPSKADASTES